MKGKRMLRGASRKKSDYQDGGNQQDFLNGHRAQSCWYGKERGEEEGF